MKNIATRIVLAALALALAAPGIATAQNLKLNKKLPVLVDRHYEIKNPSGPVGPVVRTAPDALKQKPDMRRLKSFEQRMQMPRRR